jgi:glycosyltransferase involved in cell wall biosynthesis
MNVVVCSLCYNESEILPFFLRHYSTIADEINVWDDHSTDGSRELLKAHPKVILHDWEHNDGIAEDKFLEFCYAIYPKFIGLADWVIWPDLDEFLYHPEMGLVLANAKWDGHKILGATGFNMANQGLPLDDGHSQIYDLVKTGCLAPTYNKPVIFQPATAIRWSRGKHRVENVPEQVHDAGIKLLHYRYLGYEYTKKKNARNYARCGLVTGDKGAAWSCSPSYMGEHSAEWAEKELLRLAVPVV